MHLWISLRLSHLLERLMLMGGRGKRKDAISRKEVLFTKAYESPSKTALEITSDLKSKCDNQDPLPPLSILSRAELIGTSNDVIPLADLTLASAVPKKTIQVTDKMSSVNVTKKRFRPSQPLSLNLVLIRKLTHPLSNFFLL
ncbi:hypothetical protein Tco_1240427 [Tanacetum coccineum]